mgnify:CR=1 FL=1
MVLTQKACIRDDANLLPHHYYYSTTVGSTGNFDKTAFTIPTGQTFQATQVWYVWWTPGSITGGFSVNVYHSSTGYTMWFQNNPTASVMYGGAINIWMENGDYVTISGYCATTTPGISVTMHGLLYTMGEGALD